MACTWLTTVGVRHVLTRSRAIKEEAVPYVLAFQRGFCDKQVRWGQWRLLLLRLFVCTK